MRNHSLKCSTKVRGSRKWRIWVKDHWGNAFYDIWNKGWQTSRCKDKASGTTLVNQRLWFEFYKKKASRIDTEHPRRRYTTAVELIGVMETQVLWMRKEKPVYLVGFWHWCYPDSKCRQSVQIKPNLLTLPDTNCGMITTDPTLRPAVGSFYTYPKTLLKSKWYHVQ